LLVINVTKMLLNERKYKSTNDYASWPVSFKEVNRLHCQGNGQ